MLVNPLFDQKDEEENKKPAKRDDGYALQHRKGRTLQPISSDLKPTSYTPVTAQLPTALPDGKTGNMAAIELIRRKVAALYTDEPATPAVAPANQPTMPALSKHQQFMQSLTTSGKSLAHIQTEWHNYYVGLPDDEKHEVWREFYTQNSRQPSAYTQHVIQHHAPAKTAKPLGLALPTDKADHVVHKVGAPRAIVSEHLPAPDYAARKKRRTVNRSRIKKQILDKVAVSAETQERAKEHFKSLMFGLSTGVIVLVVALFSFFNEMIIAPFIQPSRHVSATPIIVNSDSVAASETPEVLIPKINVQIPVVYDLNTTAETAVQKGLEDGIVHYSTTVKPGEQGNAAFFGHSSNNIFNKGRYKFAFVLLHELQPGDTFFLTYNKKVYTYRVYDKKVVPPTEVSVLDNIPGKTATAALITCDPPGTSTNRLVVWGEQISPDPAGATAPETPADTSTPTTLPSEGPTLLGRFWRWLF
ncbi:MAG TPA: class D sortase [Candidatus Saccharimonadales bacterium]